MGKLPSMPLFVDEYEAATAHLSMEEDGAYLRLLRLCWRSPKCSIPDDPNWIRRHMRADQDTYERVVAPIIDEFFTRKNGRVFQKRLAKEFRYVTDAVRQRKSAGSRGGKAKALKDKEMTPSAATISPQRKPSEAIAPTPTPTLTLSKKESCAKSFAEFWEAFDDKRGKEPALRSWKAIRGYDSALHAEIIAGARRYAAVRPGILEGGTTPKMAQGWLTDRRWEDAEAPRKTGPELPEFQPRKQA